jgi:hypothetical protein
MIEDHRKLLYLDCKQGHKKLGTTLEMLQWKAKYGMSDKAVEGMLKIVKDKLLENNDYRQQHMKRNRLCALWGWMFRRSMPDLMIASNTEARNTRIWKLVLCAMRYVIRS